MSHSGSSIDAVPVYARMNGSPQVLHIYPAYEADFFWRDWQITKMFLTRQDLLLLNAAFSTKLPYLTSTD